MPEIRISLQDTILQAIGMVEVPPFSDKIDDILYGEE
jgi:hypothetical protein